MAPMIAPLPIDASLPAIVDAVRRRRAVVVTAAPGAGKTTRVPPALVGDGPVLMLQPRRVAARAIARRIADEQGWTVGREVGWHVRQERVFTRETMLLVATEGILTRRLQHDPLLSAFRTVVLDEFHERSIHVDLGLAMAKQTWLARDDLRIVVMSATLDAARVAAFLDDCPMVDVPARTFPLDIAYLPGGSVEAAVPSLLAAPAAGAAACLCFLPGAPEIRRAADRLASLPALAGLPIVPLYGGLPADEQDAALQPSDRRRVILATNVAETTVTVPDVTMVIDTGLHKVARYDAGRGVDSLETERISTDSADQRAGRAGRTGPGRVVRLWDSRDRLRPHREPDIARVDLASAALDILVWGGDPRTFAWFEPPAVEALASALELLHSLGAVDALRRLTPLGHTLGRVPLHPRRARLVLQAAAAPAAARAAAVLSERHFLPPRHEATVCDLWSAVEDERALPGHLRDAARHIREAARAALGGDAVGAIDDVTFRRAVLAAYPDRIGRRRPHDRERYVLASGAGARLGRDSGVHDAEFIDVRAAPPSASPDAIVRLATRIEREWLEPTHSEVRHTFDPERGVVRATRVERLGAVVLGEQHVAADPVQVSTLLAAEYLRREPSGADTQLRRRLAFAGIDVDVETLVWAAAESARSLDDIHLDDHLPADIRRRLNAAAPTTLPLPQGRQVRLDYRDDGLVVAAVKIQHVFGLKTSPRLGPRRVPVTFELLAPNGRPAQVTSDLESFWTRGYAEVRKALRARYPKHQWPEEV